MTILPITIVGEPVLHTSAQEVSSIDQQIHTLIDDMQQTMHAAPGVGLAAPQVGVGLRIFTWHYSGSHPYDRFLRRHAGIDIPDQGRSGVVINPSLELSDFREEALDREIEREGCLSVPGYSYPLRRADHAILTGCDEQGNPLRIEAYGWLARIFQHEFDHLNGTLYCDRVNAPYDEVVSRAITREGWGKPGLTWVPPSH
ncbi:MULTISPECIES: peptide deformylase [unclassified Schaalia]|uniref:peptide deformylase n=1 Tax=unclassified Schaalia TaxID=2691889 RepID=UPI001E5BBF69|nr:MULTISPECIES: peptide deformylase [unclassified Schaalia]MCD4549661.1 peptide deformylase [Schaalia sp. lx-260]MCD4556724.1 peptide deformylase [Schaalia sp. lx-100]